ANSIDLEKNESYFQGIIDLPLVDGNDIVITTTANDNITTQTYSRYIISWLTPATGFKTAGGGADSIKLQWGLPVDSRVTHMLLFRRENGQVGYIPEGLYLEGEELNSGLDLVLKKFDFSNSADRVEFYVDPGLVGGTNYHYKAINVQEEPGPTYTFSDYSLANATIAMTYGDLTFRLYYLEDLDDKDGITTPDSEVYWDIRANFGSYPKVLSQKLTSHVALDEDVGKPNHYYSFAQDDISDTAPEDYLEVTMYALDRIDGGIVNLFVGIYEHDTAGYDKGSDDDEVFGIETYQIVYDLGSDSWSFSPATPTFFPTPEGGVPAVPYTGSAGTIELKMGVYWE
ncbi:MAG: hypothetical protein HN368_07750, partial [Spirochaetales bacterium]|nr:hypothetical protein [Spirochaetales bacterium]